MWKLIKTEMDLNPLHLTWKSVADNTGFNSTLNIRPLITHYLDNNNKNYLLHLHEPLQLIQKFVSFSCFLPYVYRPSSFFSNSFFCFVFWHHFKPAILSYNCCRYCVVMHILSPTVFNLVTLQLNFLKSLVPWQARFYFWFLCVQPVSLIYIAVHSLCFTVIIYDVIFRNSLSLSL